MGKKISIAHYLSVPAGEEGDVTIYEVEAARIQILSLRFQCSEVSGR